jgi:hypothetical protein
MKTVNTISINGTLYAVRDGMKQADIIEAASLMLMLQRIDYCCDSEYRKSFHYLEEGGFAQVRLGTQAVHETEAEARAARDAHNLTLEPKTETA